MDVGAAYPHLEMLVKTNRRSDIVGNLLVWCRKIQLVFEEPVANVLDCMRMNPLFRTLSLSSVNVNVEPLQRWEELLSLLQFHTKKTSKVALDNASSKDGPRMSAYHCIRMACLCRADGDMKRSIALGELRLLFIVF